MKKAGKHPIALFFIALILALFQCAPVFAETAKIGTTFSRIQCEYLGLDWKKAYLDILEEGFDLVRLGAYWSEIEKEEGVYDFSLLDWQLEEAAKRGIPVVLTVGMKAPRWPEYFIPDWAAERARLPFGADVSKNAFLRGRTLRFIHKVVERYKDKETILWWQVENEPLNRIGEKYWFIGGDLLKEEVALVRELDGGKRPILLTVATYPNRFLRFISRLSVRHDPIEESLKLCDIIGYNVYPVVGHRFWGMNIYFRTDPEERFEYFSRLVRLAGDRGRQVWVVELQAEPWEPGHLAYKEERRPGTGDPLQTIEAFNEFERLDVDAILLWGAEYWLYRRIHYRDGGWREMMRQIAPGKKLEKFTPN